MGPRLGVGYSGRVNRGPLDILVIGDPALTTRCAPVDWPDAELSGQLQALQDTLADFRRRKGFGRAIAAPQVGIAKRVVAVHLGATPFALINPEITWKSAELFEVWDDCLSVPDRVVRVRRHRSISLRFLDEHGRERHWRDLPPDTSELIQHEVDHLDGILMTERAIDDRSVRPIDEHAALIGSRRPKHRLSLAAIARAARSIDPVFLGSPQYACDAVSASVGCDLTLKIETQNPIRSFKGRGAACFVERAHAEGDARPLVCASAGNFGQGLAYACRARGGGLTVFASRNASPLKLERMRALGADVRLEGDDFDAAKDAARRHCASTGGRMVEDGLEPAISEGAGTIGVELLERGAAFDAVILPLGNGALINGVGRWFKAASPATRIVGVSASGADAMVASWREGRVVRRDAVSTIADGIAVRVPIPEAVDDMRGLVDDAVLVDDEYIIAAMRLLFAGAGLVTEPAGAAGIAALLARPRDYAGSRVATVLCGSNITQDQARRWLQ